jgi:hypothetical protein
VKRLIFKRFFFKNGLTFINYIYFSEKILVKYLKSYFDLLYLRFEKEKASRESLDL